MDKAQTAAHYAGQARQANTQQELDLAFATRLADIIRAMIDTYRANDPASSRSGTVQGTMRRMGRQDTAVKAIALALGQTEERVRYLLDEGIL